MDDELTWNVEVGATGTYAVDLYYTCSEKDLGSTKQRQDHAAYAAMIESTDESVGRILRSPETLAEMAETNYMLGWRYLSYEMLEEKLEALLTNIYGS